MNSMHTNPKPYPLHPIFLENEKLKEVHQSIKAAASFVLLKRKGKDVSRNSIKRYFDRAEDWHIFFNSIKPKMISDIFISNHYAIFVKNTRFGIRYLVGVNIDTDKLFIDIVNVHFYATEVDDIGIVDGIRIVRVDDRLVWRRSYMYNIDADLSPDPYEEINEHLKYYADVSIRAQGDLIVFVEKNGLKRYHESLILGLKSFIENQMRTSIEHRLMNIISNYFDVERLEIVSNIVDDKKINDAIKFLFNKFYEELDVMDWMNWLETKVIRIEKHPNELDIFNDEVSIIIREFSYIDRLTKTYNIPIRVETRIGMTKKLQRIINEIVESLEWRPIEELHGRHRISIANALPSTITVPIQLPDGMRMFAANLPLAVRGIVKLEHPEHRTKIFYFNEPVVLRFETIQEAAEIRRRRNYYRIKYKYYLNH